MHAANVVRYQSFIKCMYAQKNGDVDYFKAELYEKINIHTQARTRYFKRELHPEVQSLTLSYYTLARNNTLSLIKKTVKMIQFYITIIFGNPFIYCNAMFRFPSICHKQEKYTLFGRNRSPPPPTPALSPRTPLWEYRCAVRPSSCHKSTSPTPP